MNKLEVRGVIVDTVLKASRFSSTELDGLDNPVKGAKATSETGILDEIWTDVWTNEMPSAYAFSGRLESFTLTLTAGLIGDQPAEEGLNFHRDNFAAY